MQLHIPSRWQQLGSPTRQWRVNWNISVDKYKNANRLFSADSFQHGDKLHSADNREKKFKIVDWKEKWYPWTVRSTGTQFSFADSLDFEFKFKNGGQKD